jgi:O-antigen/teichoic acid export membrane protein
MLVSVRLIVNYFGSERYALWATITSTVTLLVFADFGIGNGLLNAISESDGKNDSETVVSHISTGFFVLLAVALFGILSLWLLYPFVPWAKIFNLTSPVAIQEAGPAAAVFIVCFLAQLPLGVVQRIQLGFQEGFFTQIWSIAGSLIGLAGLFAVIHFRAGLPFLVLAVAGAPVLAGLLNTVTVFEGRWPSLRPRLDHISRAAAQRILHLGFLFFVMQIAGAVGYQTDNLIIAQVLGANAVAQYAVPFRLFAIIPAVLAMVIAPLWPAYAEASSRGDVGWVKATFGRSMLLALAITIPANLLLVVLGRPIIRLWVGPQIVPSFLLLAGLASWAILSGISGALAMFLNGIGFIRVQAICSVFMAVSNVGLSIYLTRHIGISGVIYGSLVSQILCVFIPCGVFLPRVLAKIGQCSQRAACAESQLRMAADQVACS